MDRRWLAAPGLLLVAIAVLLLVVPPPRSNEPDPPSPRAVDDPSVSAAPDGRLSSDAVPGARPPTPEASEAPDPAPAPRVGPDGQLLPPDTPIREAGLPDRGPPLPPLYDAAGWTERRLGAAKAWETDSIALCESFADNHALSADERAAMLAALRAYHTQMASIRTEIEAGRLPAAAARHDFDAARRQVATELAAAVGVTHTAALRAELAELPGGGF